jgi:S-(hydroxymethyl)glutathione dehydrogenase/alcohol dehydrogenase
VPSAPLGLPPATTVPPSARLPMVKALLVHEPGSAPVLEDIVLGPVTPESVRIKIRAAGVCHSDLSMINGTMIPTFPLVLGHEGAGVVEEIGANVASLQVGDHVVLNWAAPCRDCWFCSRGEPWYCSVTEGVTSVARGATAGGAELHACMGIGAFSEAIVVPARSAVRVPTDVPFESAALLGCAVLTGVGAVRNTARVAPGDTVLVMGQGGVGLSAVLGARQAGASRIIAVDSSPNKESLSREAGATDFLLNQPGLARQIRQLTGGRGVDHGIECVGSASTIRTTWSSVRRGGNCVIVGIGRSDEQVTFSPMELFHFGRRLSSSLYGSADADRDIPLLAAEVTSGSLPLDTLITSRISLEDVPDAFTRMQNGEGARSIVQFGSNAIDVPQRTDTGSND